MKHKVRFKCIVAVMAVSVYAATCCAQYRILPGEADQDGCMPKTPARICLGAAGSAHCYTPPSDKDYIFGLEPKARAVGQLNGQMLTLFTSMFSGCGSGTLTNFALLTISNGEFVNLLPKVELTNQSEYEFWSLTEFSSLPVLATADYIWDYDAMVASHYSRETHFAYHRYEIDVYVFDPKSHVYVDRVHFITQKKYPGLDESDYIRVLEPEKPVILAKLRESQAK